MQFFPTSPKETYKMLPLIGRIDFKSSYIERLLKEQILGEDLFEQLNKTRLDNYIPFPIIFYDWCVDNEKYDYIKEYLTIKYSSSVKDDNKTFTFCDPFAGEANWLETIKTFIPIQNSNTKIKLIANELEENRYNTIKEKGNVDEVYNEAFEDWQYHFPKRSVSLIFYNPPYNESNGERNCKRYLQMILNRELIYKNRNNCDRETGSMIMVIREDDVLDCVDLIVKNFEIKQMYRVESDEFNKYKQWVLYCDLRYITLDDKNTYEAMSIKELIDKVNETIKSQKEFDIKIYSRYLKLNYKPVNYEQLKENFTYVNDAKRYISNFDNAWKSIKDISEVKDMGVEKLIIPKELKQGELSNLIASGYINSELSLSNGTGKHIVIGGTKNMVRTETRKEKDDKGESITVTEEIRYTEPYINILCNKDGKTQIIELGGDNE